MLDDHFGKFWSGANRPAVIQFPTSPVVGIFKKDIGLALFQQALKLNFMSALGMVEYANAMLMLDGDKMMSEATRLYQQAAAAEPIDAMERLDVELAKVELDT